MQQNPLTNTQPAHTVCVGEFVRTIVEAYEPQLRQNSIEIETDFEPIKTSFNGDLVRSITYSLIENAAQKMPNGGVISLTLIDGNHQWELEVADSEEIAFGDTESNNDLGGFALANPKSNVSPAETDLPKIVPVTESDSLRRAQLAATSHGGQIQIWDCPQGGTAHVFVAPKQRNANSNITT